MLRGSNDAEKVAIIVPTKAMAQTVEQEMRKQKISTLSVGKKLSHSHVVEFLVSWFYLLSLPRSDRQLYRVMSSQVSS